MFEVEGVGHDERGVRLATSGHADIERFGGGALDRAVLVADVV